MPRVEEDIAAFIAEADAAAPLEVCIFNPGANVNFPILETTERVFRKVWELACYGGFLTRARGGAAHAAARLGLDLLHRRDRLAARRRRAMRRSPAPSSACARWPIMARELGPRGIHVAHLIIDAGVDTAFVRERIRARGGDEALANLAPDQLMNPASVAEAYWSCTPSARRLDPRARSAALRRDMVKR